MPTGTPFLSLDGSALATPQSAGRERDARSQGSLQFCCPSAVATAARSSKPRSAPNASGGDGGRAVRDVPAWDKVTAVSRWSPGARFGTVRARMNFIAMAVVHDVFINKPHIAGSALPNPLPTARSARPSRSCCFDRSSLLSTEGRGAVKGPDWTPGPGSAAEQQVREQGRRSSKKNLVPSRLPGLDNDERFRSLAGG